MLSQSQILLERFTQKEANQKRSRLDKILWTTFSQVLFALVISITFLLLTEIIRMNSFGALIASSFLSFTLLLLWISYNGKLNLAVSLFCVVFPLGLTLLTLIYDGVENTTFYYSVFVITFMLYCKTKILKYILSVYLIGLYSYSYFFQIHGTHFSTEKFDHITNISLMILFSVMLILLSHILFSKLHEDQRELEKLIVDLKDKTIQLEKSNQHLERFTYLASHDLKSPLRTINSFVGLIDMKIKNGKTEDLTSLINEVKSGASHMNNLINDSLEYGKVEEHDNELEILDLRTILAEVHENLKTEYGNFEIDFKDLSKIKASESSIYKLFQNIIENGLKYNNSEHKKIHVIGSKYQEHFEVCIKDNGIGFEEKYTSQIFSIFKRLHNSKAYKGTGIGLAICEKIMDKYKGRIWAKSTPGLGSSFYLRFPIDLIVKDS